MTTLRSGYPLIRNGKIIGAIKRKRQYHSDTNRFDIAFFLYHVHMLFVFLQQCRNLDFVI